MTNEVALDNYRKLIWFFDNNTEIFFKDLDAIWYRGFIVDLNKEKLTMVFDENLKGTMPILLECIEPKSIRLWEDKR